jgi:sporulation protein YlmC with PRC-barrel domain
MDMQIQLGADVLGTDGKLGELEKVIADAQRDRITAMVVKRGSIRASRHVVPLHLIQRVDEGAVYVDLDEATFEAKHGYASAINAPTEDYVGPPSHDLEGTERGNMQFDAMVASGAQMQGKVLGYPGGERLSPDIHDQPSIELGMDIITNDGEKAGEVAELAFTVEDGAVARIVLKRPLIARRDPHVELPTTWVKDLAVDGILLNVSKRDVDTLLESGTTT